MTTIAFLGAGNISQAILGGLISDGYPAEQLVAFDPLPASLERAAALGIKSAGSGEDAVAAAEVVMLCVKPDVVVAAITALRDRLDGKLIVSVAAGITTSRMNDVLGGEGAIVRCMPNTPALIGRGMTALYARPNVNEAQRETAERVMGAVGKTLWVHEEGLLDAVTAVSGSGPAYFFLMMESMISAAVAEGLEPDAARTLVLQTALGAASMAESSREDPATLRQNVTSPGGTTQAALESFAEGGFEQLVASAVSAARKRSEALSGT